jgi:15-cis-phytoene synthase
MAVAEGMLGSVHGMLPSMHDAFAHCEALVRSADRDRYLSALFAPAEHRAALYALYAFHVELARIPDVVTEPLAGEVRLQWWSEAVYEQRPEEMRGHPVATALSEVIEQYRLPRRLFDDLIEARRAHFGRELFGSVDELERYARSTSSSLMELAARLMGAASFDYAGPAGISMGIVSLLRNFANEAVRGRVTTPADLMLQTSVLPQDILAGRTTVQIVTLLASLRDIAIRHYQEARVLIERDGHDAVAAWLPVATVPLDLRAMSRAADKPFATLEVSPWRRQWTLWRAARSGQPPAIR